MLKKILAPFIFSLEDHFSTAGLGLSGQRAESFRRALTMPIQKRDIVWLQRLKQSTPNGLPPVDAETLSRKAEKSVFFWLHRALYQHHEVIQLSREDETFTLPLVHPSQWSLLELHVPEDARIAVVDEYSCGPSEFTPFRAVLIHVGRGAQVKWQGVQQHAEGVTAFDHKRFVLSADAKLDYFHHVLGGGSTFEETLIELDGANAEAFSQTVFFGHGVQQQEMRVNHMHLGRSSKSQMVSKGAVSGQSHGSFLGMIQMEPGCSGADANLTEHNLLLSAGSKIDAVPGLEIGHHDVKAGHAAYMERVDEEKLFYAAARGIPEQEAMELIVEGFFRDAIAKMKNAELEEKVFTDILKYLH